MFKWFWTLFSLGAPDISWEGDLVIAYRTNPAVSVPKAFWASHDQCIILSEIFAITAARDFHFCTESMCFQNRYFLFPRFLFDTLFLFYCPLLHSELFSEAISSFFFITLSLLTSVTSFLFIKSHRSLLFLIKRLFIRPIKLRQSIKERVWLLLHCKEGVRTQLAQRCLWAVLYDYFEASVLE